MRSHDPNITQSFVKPGSKIPIVKKTQFRRSLLDRARDWTLLIDGVPSRITFPTCTGVDTKERPDIIIYSEQQKIIIWGELTCPVEENVQAAKARKVKRYEIDTPNKLSLKTQCTRNGWTVHPFTVEVGAIGFVGHSMRVFLHRLGFDNQQLMWILKRLSITSARSSYLIWSSRFDRLWTPADLVNVRDPPPSTDPPSYETEQPSACTGLDQKHDPPPSEGVEQKHSVCTELDQKHDPLLNAGRYETVPAAARTVCTSTPTTTQTNEIKPKTRWKPLLETVLEDHRSAALHFLSTIGSV